MTTHGHFPTSRFRNIGDWWAVLPDSAIEEIGGQCPPYFAANLLTEAGYKNVYGVVDGFEGDKVKDPDSQFDGQRKKNGWRNAGLPWTYSLDPNLVYRVEE